MTQAEWFNSYHMAYFANAQLLATFHLVSVQEYKKFKSKNQILLKYNQLIAPICDTKILFTH